MAGKTFWRAGAAIPGLVFCVGFLALHFASPRGYDWFSALPDGITRPLPFQDFRDVARAAVCWRAGVDVYHPSACLDGGVYNYAPLLLRIALFHIGPGDTGFAGALFCLVFFAALTLLPAPATGPEIWVRNVACLSPAVFYALEMANFDALIFGLTVCGLRLVSNSGGYGRAGYAVFALAGALKFYPAALLALVLREGFLLLMVLLAALLGASAWFVVNYGHGTLAAITVIPLSQPFRATFGALDIPLGLKLLHLLPPFGGTHRIRDFYPQSSYAADRPGAMLWSLVLIVIAGRIACMRAPGFQRVLVRLSDPQRLFLLAGAVVTVFCFCAAQNVYYRAIFLVLTLPGLWAAGQRGIVAAVVGLLWEAPLRLLARHLQLGLAFWLGRESLWWWVMIQFGAMLICAARAETGRLAGEMRRFLRAA